MEQSKTGTNLKAIYLCWCGTFHFVHTFRIYTDIIWYLKFDMKSETELLNFTIKCTNITATITLQWRHNGHDSVSNHKPHDCLLNRLFRRRSKKTSKLRVTGLCVGNSPRTGEFPAQMDSYAENVSIWWRQHEYLYHILQPLHMCRLNRQLGTHS